MNRTNIASRAARWSARHRRAAILGWIAFVVLSLGIGSAIGTQNIADEDQGNGDSRTADRIIADAGFPEDASEQVFIQSRGDVKAGDPEFQAAIREVESRLARGPARRRARVSARGRQRRPDLRRRQRGAGDVRAPRRRRPDGRAGGRGGGRGRRGPGRRIRIFGSSSSATRASRRPPRRASTRTSSRPSSCRCRSRC